jgi:hypothetical protein
MSEPRQYKTSAAAREAGARRHRRERRLKAYGQWNPWIDGETVREHIRKQQVAGLGLTQMAKVSGVPFATLCRIMYGQPCRGLPPTRRTKREVAEKVLAVEASIDNMADLGRIDATGTRRRVGAMVAAGRTQTAIAARLGVDLPNLGRAIAAPQVSARFARAVRDLYREWAFNPPPLDTRTQRKNYTYARNVAKRNGWVSAFAWDDIDDPDENPKHRVGAKAQREFDESAVVELLAGRPDKAHAVDKREAARRLLANGVGPNEVATRCHMALRNVTALISEGEPVDDAA